MQEVRENEEGMTPQEMLLADALGTAIDTERENARLRKEIQSLRRGYFLICYLIGIAGLAAAILTLVGVHHG